MIDAVHRRCSKCGKLLNVSALEKPEKRYLCPMCRGEPWYMTWDRLSEETHKSMEAQRRWGQPRPPAGK